MAPAVTVSTAAIEEVVASATDVIDAPQPEVVAAASEEVAAPAGSVVPPGFVLVPAGKFTMGSPRSEGIWIGDKVYQIGDELQHKVTLTRAFYLQSTEVTQGQWTALMKTSRASFGGCGKDCPVEQVSWFDAVAYLNALSAKEGLEQCYTLVDCQATVDVDCKADGSCEEDFTCKRVEFPKGLDCEGYRLPTEAEWEYAARAGTTTALYTGPWSIEGDEDGHQLEPIAWHGANSGVTYDGGYDCSSWTAKGQRCGTHPVGRKVPNAFGLYDVLGNVWEWTWDFYSGNPGRRPLRDPLGPGKGDHRVIRGGSWRAEAEWIRAAQRSRSPPERRGDDVGFRPARSVPRSSNP